MISTEPDRQAEAADEVPAGGQARLSETEQLTDTQRIAYARLVKLSKEAAKHALPGTSSNHDDLYDDFGLPK